MKWIKRKQVAIAFLLMFLSLIIGSLSPVIRMKIMEFRVINKIKPMVQSRPNYIPGPFRSLLGSGQDFKEAPYHIDHIFSVNCEDFKLVRFNFDEDLKLISEEKTLTVQREPNYKDAGIDPIFLGAPLTLELMIVEQIIIGEDPYGFLGELDEYDALLMINQALEENPGNKRADSLKMILDERIPITGCGGE